MWRSLHRWIAILATAYLLNMFVTGALLGWDEFSLHLRGQGPPEPGAPPPVAAPIPAAAPLQSLTETYYCKALEEVPDAPLTVFRLSMSEGHLKATSEFGGLYPGALSFNTATGATEAGPPAPATPRAKVGYHQWLKRLHRGDFIGSFYGRYLSIIAGCCFLYLTISGVVMYLQLYSARSRAGKRGYFW
ncbi:MAG TPA: PepSY-associated TM helix domain-containing protein [Steroidobacteraceae bacterium]|nr:PepSY-associated TM helix domain-containing protein [Steroidobacteraceae bacterium]